MTMTQTTLPSEVEERFDEVFCSAVGGSLQLKGCFDIGFGTSPEVMPQVKAFLAHELHLKDLEKADAVREAVKYCISVSEMTDEQMNNLEQKYGFSLSEPVLPPPQKGSK